MENRPHSNSIGYWVEQLPTHYSGIDTLRGLAALFVLFSHVYLALLGTPWGNQLAPFIDKTPLHILVNGEGAVILFFVMSGFVLALVGRVTRPVDIGCFYIKRVARIWLPYVAALIVFVAATHLLVADLSTGPYTIMANNWRAPFQLETVLLHLSLISSLNSKEYLGASWSLVHEMRVSLMFPFVLMVFGRLRWYVALGGAIVIVYSGRALALRYGFDQFSTDVLNTIYYLGMFLLGAIVANHRKLITKWSLSLSRGLMVALIIITLVLYEGNLLWTSTDLLPPVPLAEIIGCVLLLCLSLAVQADDFFAANPILAWLGRISYSLYLWHPLFMLTVYRLGHEHLGPFGVAAAVIVGSLLVAHFSAIYIEQPAIALGRKLAFQLRTHDVK